MILANFGLKGGPEVMISLDYLFKVMIFANFSLKLNLK